MLARFLQSLRHQDKGLITNGMSTRIVNLLEMIHIHHEYVSILHFTLLVQKMVQAVAVVEHRQRIRRNQLILQMQVHK